MTRKKMEISVGELAIISSAVVAAEDGIRKLQRRIESMREAGDVMARVVASDNHRTAKALVDDWMKASR